jgi:nanoRNase/pAp phosphatase (c-di-AMP/oligoRNAs hydrolase)
MELLQLTVEMEQITEQVEQRVEVLVDPSIFQRNVTTMVQREHSLQMVEMVEIALVLMMVEEVEEDVFVSDTERTVLHSLRALLLQPLLLVEQVQTQRMMVLLEPCLRLMHMVRV